MSRFLIAVILISLVFYGWEVTFPRAVVRKPFRKDFFTDAWYIVFNFIIFPYVGFNWAYQWVTETFRHSLFGYPLLDLSTMPLVVRCCVFFVARDFIHYWIHRLIHRVPWLWRFHQIHHSVEEMGFSSHLRFHFLETVTYSCLEFIPLFYLGLTVDDFLWVHVISVSIGHWNHANIHSKIGPLGYILNHPYLHAWHHAVVPHLKYGNNFGISLSVWDYFFKTAYLPTSYVEPLKGISEAMPASLLKQLTWPFGREKSMKHIHTNLD